jgi:DNA-binding GntR family transcriptional regulator
MAKSKRARVGNASAPKTARGRKAVGHGMKRPVDKKEAIEQSLRERIRTHQLLPDSRLSEKELADEFSVSRGVIREVFTKLEQRGLIKRAPKKSAVVVRLELPEVLEIYALREVLEGLCARLAATNALPESWQDLVELFGAPMEKCVKERDFDDFTKNFQYLRSRMTAAANSRFLSEMLDLINDKVREIGRRIIVLPGRAEVALQEHRALLAALRRGDAQESERLQRANIVSSCEYLRRYKTFVL